MLRMGDNGVFFKCLTVQEDDLCDLVHHAQMKLSLAQRTEQTEVLELLCVQFVFNLSRYLYSDLQLQKLELLI